MLVSLVVGCERSEHTGFPHEKITLEIGDQTLITEIACDSDSRTLGLMNRDQLPEDHGMLFIFPSEQRLRFWMKNTRIPLSIAFLSGAGEVLQIEDMKPFDQRLTVADKRGRHALEVNQGWFGRHRLGVGSRIEDFEAKLRRFQAR